MASVKRVRNRGGSESWECVGRKLNGKQIRRRFKYQRDAARFAATLTADTSRGTFIDPKDGRVRFSVYAEKWLAIKSDVSPRTLVNIEARVHHHFAALDDLPINAISRSDVLRWQSDMRRTKLSPASINSATGTLRQILDLAVRDRLIADNPARGVEPVPNKLHRDIVPLTPAQVAAVADRIDPRYAAAITLDALFVGLRAGELWALEVGDFDRLHRKLRVERSVSETRDGLVTKPTKTGRPRTLSLSADAAKLLDDHIAAYPSSGLIFTTSSGGQVAHTNFMARDFRPAVAAVRPRLPRGLRFHDLRHTHASLLLAAGWRPDQVQRRLGHASFRTTMDVYGHLFPNHDAEQLDAFDAALRESRDIAVTTDEVSARRQRLA